MKPTLYRSSYTLPFTPGSSRVFTPSGLKMQWPDAGGIFQIWQQQSPGVWKLVSGTAFGVFQIGLVVALNSATHATAEELENASLAGLKIITKSGVPAGYDYVPVDRPAADDGSAEEGGEEEEEEGAVSPGMIALIGVGAGLVAFFGYRFLFKR